MNRMELEKLLEALQTGTAARDDVVTRILAAPSTADLGDVKLDLDRRRRCGFPEVIFGEGKSFDTLRRSIARLLAEKEDVLVTRVSADAAELLVREFPSAHYNVLGRTFRISASSERFGRVAVVTAGTTDLPVAEEARETLEWMRVSTELIGDVGVAGPQRLIAALPKLVGCDAIVVAAGMEAALPSVVAGHVACPVIGVPTSVGYGANFGGLAALLSMLNSCAANVTVVNIDAGFKGGYVAGLIASKRRVASSTSPLAGEAGDVSRRGEG